MGPWPHMSIEKSEVFRVERVECGDVLSGLVLAAHRKVFHIEIDL